MNKQKQQHYGTGDIIGENKYEENALIIVKGYGNQLENHIHFNSKDAISEEDIKEFSENVHVDKVKHFKNLIERIKFLTELNDFSEAQKTIEEATTIWHNYQKLMLYNAFCTFVTTETVKLIFQDKEIDKIKKLVKASENIKKDELYSSITFAISDSFYRLIDSNVLRLNKEISLKSNNWRFLSRFAVEDYRYAMVRHINRLEFCFQIHIDTKYLKKCVDYLSGHQGFAWVVLDRNGNTIDLNEDFFEGGVLKKRNDVVDQIRKFESNYQPPTLWYGTYDEKPVDMAKYRRNKRRQKLFLFVLFLIFILIMLCIKINNAFEFQSFVVFIGLFGLAIIFFHPLGDYRLNSLQRLTRGVYKIIIR